jgi:hypothetical protein
MQSGHYASRCWIAGGDPVGLTISRSSSENRKAERSARLEINPSGVCGVQIKSAHLIPSLEIPDFIDDDEMITYRLRRGPEFVSKSRY